MLAELEQIRQRYARRAACTGGKYDPLNPAVQMSLREREQAIARWSRLCDIAPVESRSVIEIGCGTGNNLRDLLSLGFLPANLTGNDLLPERVEIARRTLPSGLCVVLGNALDLQFPEGSFDVVYQSLVFTSILDRDFQQALAARMWNWVKPGGGVLWYDFVYNNPWNRDVAGVPLRRIRQLFPQGRLRYWRVTVAPPLTRLLVPAHPALYNIANCFPFLRTHVLCWIRKDTRQ